MSSLPSVYFSTAHGLLLERIKKAAHGGKAQGGERKFQFLDKYSIIARAAILPAPMAEITVAAPVTASPPA